MINSIGTRERRKINFLARPEPGVFIIREEGHSRDNITARDNANNNYTMTAGPGPGHYSVSQVPPGKHAGLGTDPRNSLATQHHLIPGSRVTLPDGGAGGQ